jgi:chloramphenicol O-acetyltransferase type A
MGPSLSAGQNGRMAEPNPNLVDVAGWPRRLAHDLFRGYQHPWFSVCVRVDAAPLKQALEGRRGAFSLACHWAALKAMQPIEAFHLRLHGDAGVQRMQQLHAATTVARPDESFAFATLPWAEGFGEFARLGRQALDAAREGLPPPAPEPDPLSQVHCTTLPWLHFTSFTHARHSGVGTDNPKLAFGQLRAEGAQLWMPLSVDVHHALVDGLHVGRFVQGFEALLREPAAWVGR